MVVEVCWRCANGELNMTTASDLKTTANQETTALEEYHQFLKQQYLSTGNRLKDVQKRNFLLLEDLNTDESLNDVAIKAALKLNGYTLGGL